MCIYIFIFIYITDLHRKRKTKLIGCILCRNHFLKHIIERRIEERIEMKRRRRRRRRIRRKEELGDLKEMRGYSELKDEALYDSLWRTRFGRGYGPVVRRL
jgi:hypothetical protein